MKIQTINPSQFNQTVKFVKGIKVTFRNEVADIPDEEAKVLLETYPEVLFPEGQIPLPKVERKRGDREDLKTNETVEVLKEKLAGANRLVNDYKTQLTLAKDHEQIWRSKCEELLKENEALKSGYVPSQSAVEEELTSKLKLLEQANQALLAEVESLKAQLGPAVKDKKDEKEGNNEVIRSLETKTREELLQIAKELNLPEIEYKRLNKIKLIDYLISKI